MKRITSSCFSLSRAIVSSRSAPLPASSELVLLHVRRPDAAQALEHPVEQARRFIARPHRHRFVDARDIPREIRSEARALGADLVVLGLRGRAEGALPGPSLAERVLAGAQWSVLPDARASRSRASPSRAPRSRSRARAAPATR